MFQFNFAIFQGYFTMKKFFSCLLFLTSISSFGFCQEVPLNQNFLFEENDLQVFKQIEKEKNKQETAKKAISEARQILNKDVSNLRKKKLENIKTVVVTEDDIKKEAPFGLTWGASYFELQDIHVDLKRVEIKDNPESYLATHLPKPIPFFEKVFIVLGEENKLQRILAYSEPLTDNASASETIKKYDLYSRLLENKYGNKQTFFTPAPDPDAKKDNKEKKENNGIGNPNFLSQLEAGTAVLYSTYHNNNIAATLSIDVDGDKKSYIIIDYKNLKTLKEQHSDILDAL